MLTAINNQVIKIRYPFVGTKSYGTLEVNINEVRKWLKDNNWQRFCFFDHNANSMCTYWKDVRQLTREGIEECISKDYVLSVI